VTRSLLLVLVGCSAPATTKPVEIQNHPQPAPQRIEEIVSTKEPMDLIVSGGEVYWVGPDNIYHASDRPNSTPSVLLEVSHPTTLTRVGDRLVYVGDSFTSLFTISMRGGEATPLTDLPDTVWSMVDVGGLVVGIYDPSGQGPTKLLKVSGDGGITPIVELRGQLPEVVRGPEGELLVSTQSNTEEHVGLVGRVIGGRLSELAAQNASSLAGDHENVYFVGGDGDTIYRVPRNGGAPVEFVKGETTITAIAVDEKFVYWGEFRSGDPARFARMPKRGGEVEVIAEVGEITTFAIVGPYLYWNDTRRDQIKRMRR
jgi:hypothetical protein